MRQVLMAALVMFLIQPVVYADQAGTGSAATTSRWGWQLRQRLNGRGPIPVGAFIMSILRRMTVR